MFKWKCPICGKEFENFLAYVLHMEWHKRWENNDDQKCTKDNKNS